MISEALAYVFSHASPPFLFLISNKHKQAVSHRAGAAYAHTGCTVCVSVCRYKCMLIVLLIFSFILSSLLSCQEAVSLCIYKSLFLSAFPSLQLFPSLSDSPSLIPSFQCLSVFDRFFPLSIPLSLAMSVFSLFVSQHTVLYCRNLLKNQIPPVGIMNQRFKRVSPI